MRLISNKYGDYIMVIEEFVCKARPDSSSIYYVGQLRNELVVYCKGSDRIWSKPKFIEYYEDIKPAQWRNPKLKEYYINYYQMIINSLLREERNKKIDEVLNDEDQNGHLLFA